MTPLERGQSAKAHRQKRMTVKASSYIASIEAAAPASAVQAIIKMPFATRAYDDVPIFLLHSVA